MFYVPSIPTPPPSAPPTVVEIIKSIPASISVFSTDLIASAQNTSTSTGLALSNFLANDTAPSTVFTLGNDAMASLQAAGLLSPSQVQASTLASLIIPGFSMNATSVQNGQTFTGLAGNTITVNKPNGAAQATSITTTINGVTLTLPFTTTSVNGECVAST